MLADARLRFLRCRKRETSSTLSARESGGRAGCRSPCSRCGRRDARLVVGSPNRRADIPGRAEDAARSDSGRRVYSALKSSGTNSHLCGLMTMESARSLPSIRRDAPAGRPRTRRRTRRRRAATHRAPRTDRAIAGTGSTLAVDVVPTVATTASGTIPARDVFAHRRVSSAAHVHSKRGHRLRNANDVLFTESEHRRRPSRSSCAPGRSVDPIDGNVSASRATPRDESFATAASRAAASACRRRDGCSVVYDAHEPLIDRPDDLADPPQHDSLELRRGGRRLPCHRADVERGGGDLAEECRTVAGAAEVAEKRGVAPVHDAGHDQACRGQSMIAAATRRCSGIVAASRREIVARRCMR